MSECIYNEIVPNNILLSPLWLREKPDFPIFLPPVQFSRTDLMQPISLLNENKLLTDEENDEVIRFAFTSRSSRMTHGTTVLFDMHAPIPTKPKDSATDITQLSNTVAQREFENLQALFEERPVWTLSALKAHLREPAKRLSGFLAGIAFYYTTGPWRNSFVRFGYDPRKNFDSRFYQMIDYRVRQGAGFKGELKRKRTSAISKRVKVHPKYDGGSLQEKEIEENFQLRRKEAIFTTETIPPFRARHYQFADIRISEIQEMLLKIPSPHSGAVCNEKRGWLPAGFLENVRDILTRIAQTNMMKLCKEKNISLEEFKASEDSKSETFDESVSGDEEEEGEDDDAEEFPNDDEEEN